MAQTSTDDVLRARARDGGSARARAARHSIYQIFSNWAEISPLLARRNFNFLIGAPLTAIGALLLVGLIFAPIAILVANLFERRGSFGVAVRQEYAGFASTLCYGWAAASLAAIPLVLLSRVSGIETAASEMQQRTQILQQRMQQVQQMPPEAQQQAAPQAFAELLGVLGLIGLSILFSPLPLFGFWAVVAVREVFRFSWWRALAVVIISGSNVDADTLDRALAV